MTYITVINAFAKFVLNDLTFCGNLKRARRIYENARDYNCRFIAVILHEVWVIGQYGNAKYSSGFVL